MERDSLRISSGFEGGLSEGRRCGHQAGGEHTAVPLGPRGHGKGRRVCTAAWCRVTVWKSKPTWTPRDQWLPRAVSLWPKGHLGQRDCFARPVPVDTGHSYAFVRTLRKCSKKGEAPNGQGTSFVIIHPSGPSVDTTCIPVREWGCTWELHCSALCGPNTAPKTRKALPPLLPRLFPILRGKQDRPLLLSST